jgi:hypothetical protein
MEYSAIRDHLKYVNANGVTLSIEERMNLDLALQKLHLDFGFEELLLWGKINGKSYLLLLLIPLLNIWILGVVNDYYVAVGLNYTGVNDFPKKRYFWCSTATNWAFAELPKPMYKLGKGFFEKIESFFTGEFDRLLLDINGKPAA